MLPRGATQVVFRAIVLSGARDLHGRVRGHIFVLDPPGVGGGLPIKKSLDSASFGGLKIRSEWSHEQFELVRLAQPGLDPTTDKRSCESRAFASGFIDARGPKLPTFVAEASSYRSRRAL